jgi:hypothetical protein
MHPSRVARSLRCPTYGATIYVLPGAPALVRWADTLCVTEYIAK